MNFFERQQVARRKTSLMIALFLVAIVCIVLAIDFVAALAWHWHDMRHPVPKSIYVWATVLTAGAILVVSGVEIMSLRLGGGDAVAIKVGARRIPSSTQDPLERRLLNVVEEMAIAAGTRVPSVYVMDDEQGINAFAAGYDVSRAAVTVTRGTLETLNRDELQAVIGHEFSHIVNGDMSLNIRMMGVLAGIVFLGAVGGFLLRNTRRTKDSAPIVLVGTGLFVVGYIGLLFARIIKASVSREREYLADASSVQFTRNPDGLAGALDQIRSSTSLVSARRAEDVSHMFFGEGISMSMSSLFATHPPIDERIKRVNPRFQPEPYRGKRAAAADVAPVASIAPEEGMAFGGAAPATAQPESRASDAAQSWGRSPRESAAMVGKVDDRKVEIAQRILAAIPEAMRERMRDPKGAAATLVALILANNDAVSRTQLEAVKKGGAVALSDAAAAIAVEMRAIGPAYYLAIVDLALPALKVADPGIQSELLTALQNVIHSDRRVSVFEFVVFTLVRTQLSPHKERSTSKYKSIGEVRDDALLLLSLIVHAGCHGGPNADAEAATAFKAGVAEMGLADGVLLPRTGLKLDKVGEVLDKLRDLAPMPKAVLVKGLFAAASADGEIRIIEAALMRTVGAVLDCPLPPLLEDLDPETLRA
jgi:Zn-dependent protease with chaperone function